MKCARVGDGVLGSVAFSEGIVHDLGEAESDYRVDEMADFLEKAEEALKVAELAYQNGCYNEAVSRSYFATLKAALSLLASLGLKPKNTVRVVGKKGVIKVASGLVPDGSYLFTYTEGN